MAWGMRWRKASPSKPPEAKLKSTFSRVLCWLVLSRGMKKRITKGAALMTTVEARE